jgi:hypothetical protein
MNSTTLSDGWFNDDRQYRALPCLPVVQEHCSVDSLVQELVVVYMNGRHLNARRRLADRHCHSGEYSPVGVAADFWVVQFVFSIQCLEYFHYDQRKCRALLCAYLPQDSSLRREPSQNRKRNLSLLMLLISCPSAGLYRPHPYHSQAAHPVYCRHLAYSQLFALFHAPVCR